MKMKPLKIGKYVSELPIIQGGMSILNSRAPLAAAVSNAGGIGVIGASAITLEQAIEEVKQCRELTKGVVAVNIMYAITKFVEMVQTCIDAGVDMIFSGAGFSRDIYKMVEGTETVIVSIVSSAKIKVGFTII